MHILYDRKIVFIHIPKTAGTSIASALGREMDGSFSLSHFTPSEAKKYIFQDGWERFYSFSVVRNPWERYISLYHYHKSGLYAANVGINHSHRMATAFSFDEWMTFNIATRLRSNWFGVPQENWWQGVTEVFPIEKPSVLQERLENRLDRTIQLPKLNMRTVGAEKARFTNETAKFVSNIDSKTIERWRYSPEEYM